MLIEGPAWPRFEIQVCRPDGVFTVRAIQLGIPLAAIQFCTATYSVWVSGTPPSVKVRGTASLAATFGTSAGDQHGLAPQVYVAGALPTRP